MKVMIKNGYKIFLALVVAVFTTVTMYGQPKPYINKSPKPISFESVLPGFSSYEFLEEEKDSYDFAEAYFIEELKKWINAVRPGIRFGADNSKPGPENLLISYEFSSRTRLANNGVWWWDISNAIVYFQIDGLNYEYEFSIPRFSVEGNNFGNHVLYNSLLKSVASHIYSYDKSKALHLADYRSGYDEAKLKSTWKNEGCKLYEGIYEDVASDNGKKRNKYNLAMKYINDKPCLLYLKGANVSNDWKEGEYKAWLEPTATPNIFKAQWLMADKDFSSAYVTFNNGAMLISISGSNRTGTLIKIFPTATDGISIAGAQPSEWTGTGFALKDNYIVTNYHVVDGAKSISILGVNGSFNKSYSADVIASDKNNDLAILKVNGVTIPSANIPYSVKTNTAEVGEEVFVLGYPLTSTMGDEIKLTTGVVSSKSGFQGDVSLYQISAPIQPGNSGGPLFDSKGNVIGIVSAKHRGAENVSYAIKASYLRNLMESAVPNNILPQTNKISAQNLSGKVKAAKIFVYYIVCSNRISNDNSSSQSLLNKGVETNTSTKTVQSTNKAEEYYNIGQKYDKDGKYAESLEWYIKAANLGHIRSQYILGYMYSHGEGTKKDYTKAIEWYTKAANQGYTDAQFNLGNIYENGEGVKQDYKKAFEWYQKAANQDDVDAQSRLGRMYFRGDGVTQDYSKAFEWFQKSANQDDVLSQFILGSFYHSGTFVKQDYSKAYEWYQKAAKQDYADAQFYLGSFYYNGIGVSKDVVMGQEWIKKAANQGHANAQFFMGSFYYNGIGVKKDYTKAFEWTKKAADQGNPEAQLFLGSFYSNGIGVNKDINKAFEWTKKAADQGNPEAQLTIGSCYYNGIGVNKDINKAVEWTKKAADQGDINALRTLGELFYEGKEVKQDIKNSELYLTQAAEKGDAIAMNELGWYFFKGNGFSLDYSKAESWFKKSIETDPSWAYPYSNMALLYAKRDKNFTEAIRYSDLAIARVSDKEAEEQAVIYGERGLVYYWKGDMENAKIMLDKCIELNPNYLEGDYDFAKVMKSYKE